MTASVTRTLATVDGWPITLPNMPSTVEALIAAARAGEGFMACTLNLDHLVKLRRDPAFRKAYGSTRFVTADGTPVAMLARLQHKTIERTTGADLIVPLAEAAAREQLPIYLFGTTPAVLARAGRRLSENLEGRLDIAGTSSPPADFDPEGPDADAALDRIAASGAKLCIVALGAPKQEIFAARAVERGVKVGFVCAGAALDFIAGAQVRAPETLQRAGLEWLWRLMSNPGRLAARYAQCALLLADLALVEPMRQRLSGKRA